MKLYNKFTNTLRNDPRAGNFRWSEPFFKLDSSKEAQADLRAYFEAFTLTLFEEVKEGRTDILNAFTLANTAISPVFIEIVSSHPLKKELVTQALLNSVLKKGSRQGSQSLVLASRMLHPFMGEEDNSSLFQKFLNFTDQEKAWGEVVLESVYQEVMKLFVRSLLEEEEMHQALKFLLVNRESSGMAPPARVLLSKIRNADLNISSFPPSLFDLRGLPYFVREFNRSFFHEQVKQREIDPQILELLFNSWEGDFGSLLESAASLSAEVV